MLLRLICLCLVMSGSALAETQRATVGGREYLIDLPSQSAGAPLIVALHGGGGSPAQFARSSGISKVAIPAGFAVAYPAGSGRGRFLTWNGGYCCGYAARKDIDDVAFLEDVIQDAVARFGVDRDRVFMTGMSNGAIMAEAYAAVRPGDLRAVAGVAGTLDLKAHPPRAALPILHIHGTADTRVPYAGGQTGDGLTTADFTPVPAVIEAFKALTPSLVRQDRTLDRVKDGTRVVETTWRSGDKPMIRLMTIEGGGHVWPKGARSKRQANATQEIDASDEIIRFFGEFR